MNDTDDLTTELRDLLTAAHVPPAPPLAAITTRGRARRQHRRLAVAGLSVAGAIAATAVGLNLSSSSSPARTPIANQPVKRGPGPTTQPVAPSEIRDAAFTLVRHADGTITLRIDPSELFDPTALERDLQADGIPAQITPGKICSSDPAPGEVSDVVVWHPSSDQGGDDTITIDPSAMPAGSELSFGIIQLRGDAQAAQFTLIDPNANTCSTNVLNDAPPRIDHGGVYRIPPSN